MSRAPDTRWAVIEDAVALLQMLPPADRIAWPSEAGDLEAVDEALAWMSTWLPRVKAARREHRRTLKGKAATLRAVARL